LLVLATTYSRDVGNHIIITIYLKKYSVIFLAWGDRFIQEVNHCILKSNDYLSNYDLILITDQDTDTKQLDAIITKTIRADFKEEGLLRKTELHRYIPSSYDAYLFLDSDTIVINDISLGFEKAEIHGIAVSYAPHYSLDAFWGFDEIMKKEELPRNGQLQYNTGVIFFNNSSVVNNIFTRWGNLGNFHRNFKNDQPFFTLAMEQLQFNPYTLSISYNYRGFGDAISGDVRIWHSHGTIPVNINKYDVTWPPRRAWPGKIETGSKNMFRIFFKKIRSKVFITKSRTKI
jgi:hypothetical protein